MSDKQEENTFLQQELEDSGLDLDHRQPRNKIRGKSNIKYIDDDGYDRKHRYE